MESVDQELDLLQSLLTSSNQQSFVNKENDNVRGGNCSKCQQLAETVADL